MTTVWRTRTRRAALALAALTATWAAVIALTGGLSVKLGGVRFSSHATQNPTLLAIAAAAIAVWLSRPSYRATLIGDLRAGFGAARGVSPATWVLVIGIALRLWRWLLAPPFWLDEEMIALNLRGRTMAGLGGMLWLGQAAPFGWLVTQRLIGLTFGFGELALRAVPVGFGVATVVASWWAGRRWLSAAGATALVFLFAAGQWLFHFSLEVKHYSADTFFGLLLPVLVVWALEGTERRDRLRRAFIWWIVAIAGQAWSMGGLLVAPACAIALLSALWRRDGIRSALIAAAAGCVWLAAFGLHYAAALRFTVHNPLLQETWSNRMAPEGAGLAGRLIWMWHLAEPLALNPGGAGLVLLFWATALCGFIAARPRLLGAVCAALPMSAAVLGIIRVTPLYERFTLWAVPAMYFGIALAFDAGIRWARTRATPPRIGRAPGVVLSAAALVICVDVGFHSFPGIFGTRNGGTNHGLDDRSASALASLNALGTLTALRTFGPLSVAGIIELTPAEKAGRSTGLSPALQPCFSAKPAVRW